MSTSPRTKQDCQKMIFNLGIKFGVSPKLIGTRMLDDQDKRDMLSRGLTIEALESAVGAGKANGMFITEPPLKKGIRTGYRHEETLQELEPLREKCHYRKPFLCHPERFDCHCRTLERA